MRKRFKILMGAALLCVTAATARLPMSYAEAESASASDFQMKGDLLVKYTGTASAVSIPTSVKQIGKEAFAGHTELVKVDIPAYVESIDYNAFRGCTSLETVKVPDTVTEIGNGAFSDCGSLKSVTLGKKLKKLGNGVFANCDSLSTLNISRKNEEFVYDKGVIYSKDKKTVYGMIPGYPEETYKMPSTVGEIRINAFWGCKKLKRVEISNNVKSIPDYAFANCTSLEKVIIPYSLNSIGLQAFSNCVSLGETQIPMSVKVIHATAFDGCPKLSIVAEAGSYAAEYEEKRDKSNVAQAEYQDIAVTGNADSEGNEGNENNGGGEVPAGGTQNGSVSSAGGGTPQDSGVVIGQSAVVGGNAVVFMDNSRSRVLSGNVKTDAGDAASGAGVMDSPGGLKKYTVVDNRKVAAQAFYSDASLTEYTIPDGIQEIGDFSFARSGLASIRIPDGVTSIGYGAFYHCDNLAQVEIPASVTEIEPSAFASTQWMRERLADKENPFTIVGDGILVAYSGMNSTVEIPAGVKQIGAEVFQNNTRITSVKMPESLTVIGEDAFAGCSGLTNVSMGSGIREIKDRAFEGCPVSTVKIPASVQQIGLKAYDMSEAGKEDGTRVAVFLGRNLPKVSYEKTATRLANGDYRDAVMKGVDIAIVDGNLTAQDIAGSVLSHDLGGFRGWLCSVDRVAEGDTPGRLKVKFCSMPDTQDGGTAMPELVTVYGQPYEIYVEDGTENLWGSTEDGTGEGSVRVELRSSTIPSSPVATAEIAGDGGNYILRISDNATAGSDMAINYRKVSGGSSMKSLQVYDIALYEAARRIPISRLGRQVMTVTVPKPMGILEENLRVVCLDDDGQLEQVESRLVTVDGQTCVQFQVNHFSVFGIYN